MQILRGILRYVIIFIQHNINYAICENENTEFIDTLQGILIIAILHLISETLSNLMTK